jgi:hypothetical protein
MLRTGCATGRRCTRQIFVRTIYNRDARVPYREGPGAGRPIRVPVDARSVAVLRMQEIVKTDLCITGYAQRSFRLSASDPARIGAGELVRRLMETR